MTLRAVQIDRFGGPEELHLREVEPPQPRPNEVVVTVRAAGVNPFDLKVRRGDMQAAVATHFPAVLGIEAAGVIASVGSDVDGLSVGDAVCGNTKGGAYAEQTLIPRPVRIPGSVSMEQAATVPVVGEAAFRVIEQLDVTAGEAVLIHGAAGSVGRIAVQLAVARGAAVIGTCAAADEADVVRLGATPVEYGDGWAQRVREVAPSGVDAVLDAAGAGVLGESVELAGGPARVITIADSAAQSFGVRFSSGSSKDRAPQALPALLGLLAADQLEVVVGRTYPLARAADAHRDVEEHRARGKVVLLP